MDLTERIAWAVGQIKKDTGLSWPKLANILGTNKDTVAHYAKGQGEKILGGVVERIASKYNYSSEWLLMGKGEPYPGARAKHPEVCGPETPYIKEGGVSIAQAQPAPEPEPPNLGGQFMEDINHLKVIYDYEDLEIINAIHSNLRIFNRTVQREIEVKELKQKVAHLELENAEQKARIDNLEAAVATLMAEREAAQAQKKTATNA